MNVVVICGKDKDTRQWEYASFATTDLSLNARQVILLYRTRPGDLIRFRPEHVTSLVRQDDPEHPNYTATGPNRATSRSS